MNGMPHHDAVTRAVSRTLDSGEGITVLTGAGVSAESGVPTFRGPEGYWTIGSRNYQPHEIATQAMLRENPREVWKWYLFRRGICRSARPNPGHLAIARMENALGDRFRLITQNVDGLHRRAGNDPARTFEIHGNLNFMRCGGACSPAVYPIPEEIPAKARGEDLTESEWRLLRCPACDRLARPHVLFWDEYYDEQHYRFNSALLAASRTALLIVVGTTGATTLPHHIVTTVVERGGTLIDINIAPNVFSEAARKTNGGVFLQGKSGDILPALAERIAA